MSGSPTPIGRGRGTGRGPHLRTRSKTPTKTAYRNSGPPRKKPPILPEGGSASPQRRSGAPVLGRKSTSNLDRVSPRSATDPGGADWVKHRSGGGSTKQLPTLPTRPSPRTKDISKRDTLKLSGPPRSPPRSPPAGKSRGSGSGSGSRGPAQERHLSRGSLNPTRGFTPSMNSEYDSSSSEDEFVNPAAGYHESLIESQVIAPDLPEGTDPLYTGVASEDYDAENHRELSFKEGDVIYVLFYNSSLSWAKGCTAEGDKGFFQAKYVSFDFEGNYPVDSPAKSDGDVSVNQKREKLIQQVLVSEQAYVRDLGLMDSMFLGKLPLAKPSTIFSNLKILLKKQQELLTLFSRKARTEEPIGDIFLRMADLFDEYGLIFVNNTVNAVVAVEHQIMNNYDFAVALAEVHQKQACRGLKLHEFLVKPCKRIKETHALVRMLLAKTAEDHPDYDDLLLSSVKLKKIQTQVEDVVSTVENILKIVEIERNVPGLGGLVNQTRRYVRDVMVVDSKGKKDRKLFLLSDMIISAPVKKGQCGKGTLYPLASVQLSSCPDTNAARNCMELTSTSANGKKEKKKFSFETIEERESFLHDHSTGGTSAAAASPPKKPDGVPGFIKADPSAKATLERDSMRVSPRRGGTKLFGMKRTKSNLEPNDVPKKDVPKSPRRSPRSAGLGGSRKVSSIGRSGVDKCSVCSKQGDTKKRGGKAYCSSCLADVT